MPTLYGHRCDECYALYEQGKYIECAELDERSLKDPGMSLYHKYHPRGSSELKPEDPSVKKDVESLQDLGSNLDDLYKYQAKRTPKDYPIEYVCHPPRRAPGMSASWKVC